MQIIKVHGRPRVAYLEGEKIEREDVIFVRSEGGWFRTIEYDNHFVYRQTRRIGSALMCTCGGVAGIFGYEAYARFSSTNMGRIVCCVSQINSGRHADGSS